MNELNIVNVKDVFVPGINTGDDPGARMQAAIDLCESQNKVLYIPNGVYTPSKKLICRKPIGIISDPLALIRWTNRESCGIRFDFRGVPSAFADIRLPALFSPAIDSTFCIPGYRFNDAQYDVYSRIGVGVELIDADRTNISIQYSCGWYSGLMLVSREKALANINVNIHTMDFCYKGLNFFGEQTTSAVVATINTIWAKYPIYLDATDQLITGNTINIPGQTFVNERGGCVIYGRTADPARLTSNTFNINWISAGRNGDSPPNTPDDLKCPYLGGNGEDPAQLYDDGVQTFDGRYNSFYLGSSRAPVNVPAMQISEDDMRIRNSGIGNKIIRNFV